MAKVLEFQVQHHSLQRNPKADLLQNGLVGSPCSPRDSQESSPTPRFKSINSSTLSLLHSPTLTSIRDHRKNHSLDYRLGTNHMPLSPVAAAAAAAKSLQSCRILCDPIDGSPPGAPVPGILQARTLEWVSICHQLPAIYPSCWILNFLCTGRQLPSSLLLIMPFFPADFLSKGVNFFLNFSCYL